MALVRQNSSLGSVGKLSSLSKALKGLLFSSVASIIVSIAHLSSVGKSNNFPWVIFILVEKSYRFRSRGCLNTTLMLIDLLVYLAIGTGSTEYPVLVVL